MKAYIISLLAGMLVGCLYHLMKVRSPAPPLIALVGLLGILIGENAVWKIKEHLKSKNNIESQIKERKNEYNGRFHIS